ncbi:MAG: radical SAM protein [bacterium]
MRVLLVSSNFEKVPAIYPLGMATLAGWLRSLGHRVDMLDLCFEPKPEQKVIEAIQRSNGSGPDVIGLSIRNLDNTLYPEFLNIDYTRTHQKFAHLLKKHARVPIVAGGSGFSLAPQALLKYLDLEIGIIGDGEMAMAELLRRLSEGKPYDDIPGLMLRGKPAEPWKVPDLTDFPKPWRQAGHCAQYATINAGIWGNIQSKRGCPMSCSYCVYPNLEGQTLRFRDPRQVAAEMKYCRRNLGISDFSFVDNLFNLPLDHAAAICEEILRAGLDIRWDATFYPHPEYLSQDFLLLAARSGCNSIDFGGMDSASSVTLKGLGKGFTVDQIMEAAEMVKASGMRLIVSLLLGGPNETLETITESLDRVAGMDPDCAWISLGIRIYANTELERIARRERIIAEDDDLLHPRFYVSPHIENGWWNLIDAYRKKHPQWAYVCLARDFGEWDEEILKYATAYQNIHE